MARIGIDTSKFKPHATRAAAASAKVKSGQPIEKVAVEGDWGGLHCLEEWYVKDVVVAENSYLLKSSQSVMDTSCSYCPLSL